MDRYDRQARIQDWDQSRLTGATLVIAGSGQIAFFAGLMAAAMGFGRLVLVGRGGRPEDDGTFGDLVKGPVAGWARWFRRLNPQVHVYPVPRRLGARDLARLPDLDLVLLCGNDPRALRLGEELAGEVPVVAGSAAGQVGVWGRPRLDRIGRRLARFPESALVGQIVAGLLVDETRRRLMPLATEIGPKDGRHVFALPKLPGHARVAGRPRNLGHDLTLVGAGALGTWLGLALGAAGVKRRVDIYDPDTVDPTNLNRQVLFHDAVGQPKALVLGTRLRGLFPGLEVNAYQVKVDESAEQHLGRHGLLAACPDNFQARACLGRIARRARRTLVNGGTSPFGGSCMTYVPGATPCLDCAISVELLARDETGRQAAPVRRRPRW